MTILIVKRVCLISALLLFLGGNSRAIAADISDNQSAANIYDLVYDNYGDDPSMEGQEGAPERSQGSGTR